VLDGSGVGFVGVDGVEGVGGVDGVAGSLGALGADGASGAEGAASTGVFITCPNTNTARVIIDKVLFKLFILFFSLYFLISFRSLGIIAEVQAPTPKVLIT
jgi:hypothetical protein